MNRIITEKEEQAYRLVSGDFKGLSVVQAAVQMGISKSRVHQLLKSTEKKAPQLFPLLTKREAEVLHLLERQVDDGDVQDVLDLTPVQFKEVIRSLRIKGRLHKSCHVPTVAYQSYMDNQIVRKF